jgi:iron complex outermembrane receptor protein
MMDGRTLYTPLFAGVFWDAQDAMLEDLDRIEVVSGPGATLWGANAVNGVINIISKPANETQGFLGNVGGGTFLQDFASARYGGKIGEDLYFRIYGKYFDRDDSLTPSGAEGTNAWRFGQAGFRLDYLPRGGDTLTVQGDGYGSAYDQTRTQLGYLNGQNVVGRWNHPLGPDSDMTVQAYWDRTWRDQPAFKDQLNTFDVDFQHQFALFERVLGITWGAEYRAMLDRFGNTPAISFIPPDRNLQLFSSFLQGDIVVVPDRFRITLGTKLEHNDYSGFEVEPSSRLAYTPSENQTWWFAASRAVRAPSRIDEDLVLPGVPPFIIVRGGDFKSEDVIALEPGYRVRPFKALTLSIAGFYNFYDNIRSLEPIATNVFVIRNGNRGETGGVELSATWQATDWWRLRGGYTYLYKNIFVKPGESDLNQGRAEGNDPENQFLIQSILDLPWHLQLDGTLRYVDSLPSPHVPAYVTMDVRLAWHATPNLEFSIVGQNLFDKQHPEFGDPATRQEIPRSVYGKVTWRF